MQMVVVEELMEGDLIKEIPFQQNWTLLEA